MSFQATVLTLFPEMFPGALGHSLAGKAMDDGLWSLEAVQIRDFAHDRHKTVDDTPFGGGAGMVMRPDVVAASIDDVHSTADPRPLIYLTPRGRPLDQSLAGELATGPGVVLLCGRYEGVDQRVIEARGCLEVSLGDFVLSGGELAALVLLDAIIRLIPGVVNKRESVLQDSFSAGILEYPHYTKPQLWEGRAVPEVLLSGHHAKIEAWRRQQALDVTKARRPDLLNSDGQPRPMTRSRLDHPCNDVPELEHQGLAGARDRL